MVPDCICFSMSNYQNSYAHPQNGLIYALIPNTSKFHPRFSLKLDLEIHMSQTLLWLCFGSKFHHILMKNHDLTLENIGSGVKITKYYYIKSKILGYNEKCHVSNNEYPLTIPARMSGNKLN